MFPWLTILFDTSDFPPRWQCGEWSAALGWTHIVSDLGTFGAYVTIPFVLLYFIKRRADMPFPSVFYLFAGFIFACGTVHLVEATIFWYPWYRLSALFKVATMVVSWGTVAALVPVLPRLFALRTPDELRQAEERFRTLLESAPDAMVIVDSGGQISLVNKQAERVFGYGRRELIGKPVEILIPERFRKSHPGLRQGFTQKNPKNRPMGEGMELMGLRGNGEEFPVEISLSPIEFPGSTAVCSAIRDVTEKKRNQERLLQSERLSAVGEAMTGLVHESRNALARSQASLKLLARQLADRPETQRYIDEALRAQKDVQHLFEEVRHYAAPQVTQRKLCPLRKVVSDTWENLTVVRESRDAELRQADNGIDTSCEIDAFAVGGVFRNLMENSLAACPDPVRLEVSYREVELDKAPALEIRFRDNGPGIPEGDLERIFEAFFTTKTHGTGLGLAIAKRSIEEHGGEIFAIWANGGDLEFVIVIPRKST